MNPKVFVRKCSLISFCLLACACMGAEHRVNTNLPFKPTDSPTNFPLKQVGPELYELGGVRLDKRQKAVSFPAMLNMREALVEYLVVTSSGKTHESLLRTDIQPYHLHLALLLLGVKGVGTNSFPEDALRPIPGDRVNIEVSWNADGKKKRYRAEELVYDRQTKSAMSRGSWVYNGSQMVEGIFVAQQDGSLISLVTDPDALINNPRPGRDDDDNWQVNSIALPPVNSPVQVTITVEKTKARR